MPYLITEIGFSCKDLVDGHDHFSAGGIFGNISIGAIAEHFIDVGPFCLNGNPNDLDIRAELADALRSVYTVNGLHIDIHQHYIRLPFPGGFYCFLSIGTLRDDPDPGRLIQDPAPGFTYVKMIINDNYLNHESYFYLFKITAKALKKTQIDVIPYTITQFPQSPLMI